MRINLVLVAAGSSSRAGCDKLYQPIGGSTALERSVLPFLAIEGFSRIIVVSRKDCLAVNRKIFEKYADKADFIFAEGGKSRTESVRKGLAFAEEDCDLVAVHDAARPFVTERVIRDAMEGALREGGAVPSLKSKDTVLLGENGVIRGDLDRSKLYLAQTPQIFRTRELLNAYKTVEGDFTDDATLYRRVGGRVALTAGDEANYKLTTPPDMERSKKVGLRIGHGYDAHRFEEGRKLMLCGVEVPSPMGLKGVSDADAPLHALIDALFGAAGLPDIGRHFPPNDQSYEGIDSMVLLERTLACLREVNANPISADVTIIAQTPKLASYLESMKDRLTGALRCPCNVKATTEEKMGFTGRKEGISAHAVVLCEVKE